jgi:hypothetical protein
MSFDVLIKTISFESNESENKIMKYDDFYDFQYTLTGGMTFMNNLLGLHFYLFNIFSERFDYLHYPS